MSNPTVQHEGRNTLCRYNGTITVTNTETGNHRTFRILTRNFGSQDEPEPKRVVSLLTGPDNGSDYMPFGFIDNQGRVVTWKRYRGQDGKSDWQKFASILTFPEAYPGCEYAFSVRCRRCGRELTTPESIKSGIGPICAKDE